MGSNNSNSADIQQKFMTNILQENTEKCVNTVKDQTNGNTVIVTGSTVGGDFTGVQATTNTDFSCVLTSGMDANARNMLSSQIQQKNKTTTSLFGDFSFTNQNNSFDSLQQVTNNISLLSNSVCESNTAQSTNNNYVYVSDSKVNGNFVGVVSTTNAKADCTLNNAMKAATFQHAQASANQGNSLKPMFAAILTGLFVVMGLGIVLVIIVHGTGTMSHIGKKEVPNKLNPTQQDIAAAKRLGVTPEVLLKAEKLQAGTPITTATPATAPVVTAAIPTVTTTVPTTSSINPTQVRKVLAKSEPRITQVVGEKNIGRLKSFAENPRVRAAVAAA